MEWARVHNQYYGTPKASFKKILKKKKIPLLLIDVQGAAQLKKKLRSVVLIFIRPENLKVLKKWLKKRAKNKTKDLKTRLENAKKELEEAKKYNYQIINRDSRLKETINLIANIILKHLSTKKIE